MTGVQTCALPISPRIIQLPTWTNLRTRQVELNDSRCPLCNRLDEDATHLFFHCTKTLPLWWESQSWINSSGVFPHNPKYNFLQHENWSAVGVRARRWKCWWVALTWTIWKHRNRVVFDNQSFYGSTVMDDALFLLWSCSRLWRRVSLCTSAIGLPISKQSSRSRECS